MCTDCICMYVMNMYGAVRIRLVSSRAILIRFIMMIMILIMIVILMMMMMMTMMMMMMMMMMMCTRHVQQTTFYSVLYQRWILS